MPTTTCERCIHYRPDAINPPAGMGSCAHSLGYWHPMAPHFCREREAAHAAA